MPNYDREGNPLAKLPLKPCPFCGYSMAQVEFGVTGYQARCTACSASTAIVTHRDDATARQLAADHWNKRTEPRSKKNTL